MEDCKENRNRTSYKLNKSQLKLLLTISILHNNGLPVVNVRDINQQLNFTERVLYYNLNKLIENDFVTKDEGSVLIVKLSDKGKSYIEDVVGNLQIDASYVSAFLDRAHRITIMQPIIQRGEKPARFEEKDKSAMNWKQNTYVFHDEKYSVEINPKAVYYHFHELYGIDPHHITFRAVAFCFRFAQTLAKEGWKLDLPKTVTIQQEHAIFSDALAQFTMKYNLHYKSDRLVFDGSIATNEFELVHPEYAPEDFVRVTGFLEGIIREKIDINSLAEMLKLLPQIKELLQINQQNKQSSEEFVND